VLEFGFADIDGEAGGVLRDEDLELVAETSSRAARRR
jgi:hypothetical protein